ncbi:MAG: hypothetical protein LBF94_02435 [Puniceicoccales bacterium]|jgi:hypothetical protein|nr:hypothetical protein [Puniceicoccales bacterium]
MSRAFTPESVFIEEKAPVFRNGESYKVSNEEIDAKKALAVLNSGSCLILGMPSPLWVSTISPYTLATGPVDIETPNPIGSGEKSLSVALAFTDRVTGEKQTYQTSLEELMCMVMFLMLEAAKDQRSIIGADERAKRLIVAKSVETTYQMRVESATAARDAARQQAIGHIVSGTINVVGGISSFAYSTWASKSGTGREAGGVEAEAAPADAQRIQNMVQMINQLTSGLGQIVAGAFDFTHANLRFKADMLNANIEVIQSFMQTVQADISAEGASYRDASQQISETLSIIKMFFQMKYDILSQIMRNIV